MGVNGLWTVLQPCARPTNLATLNRKRLAVDASIWIYQFLKAVRDKEGNALRNSHVVGFFRRICKLLWFGILPVFVFDGGAPQLKRATLQGRRRRREGRREDAVRTAGKLLAVQMQRLAEEEEGTRKRRRENAAAQVEEEEAETGIAAGEVIPNMENVVYADEAEMSTAERQKSRKFFKQDAYHLPEIDANSMAAGRAEDPRIMSVQELEEYARQFHDGEDVNLYDFSKIDFDGDFFKSLPPPDRYNILNAARLRSRLRMGLSKEQLDDMFPDRMAFSRFQIERVKERNHLTQRLMTEVGMTGTDMTIGGNGRIVGEKNREYILVKNDGAEGGWALGVVSNDRDIGEEHKPIDVDALQFQYQAKEDSSEDEEFEDVPVEGLNRLPKLSNQGSTNGVTTAVDDEAMFVDGNEDLNALLEKNKQEQNALLADEDEDVNRAIAMSLKSQYGVGEAEVNDELVIENPEDVAAPEWKQKAVEAAKPITTSNGSMVAHIVNNRANASVPKRPQRGEQDSDSEDDLQAALAVARKKRQAAAAIAPPRPAVKNPFGGPLPFEKLDWKPLLDAKKRAEQPKPKPQPTVDKLVPDEAKSDHEDAGGFVIETPSGNPGAEDGPKVSEADPKVKGKEKARPLPPWLVNNDTDIRDSLKQQVEAESHSNAADRSIAMEEERRRRKELRERQVVEIDSSDDGASDVEIIDAPPQEEGSLPTESVPRDGVVGVAENDAELPGQTVVSVSEPEASKRSASPEESEEEFEEVNIEPQEPADSSMGEAPPVVPAEQAIPAKELTPIEVLEELTDQLPPMAQQERVEGIASIGEGGITFEEGEFDDFSDPEEEELLAQMAEEAEEHARFASTLNHKSTEENQASYEAELKALRTQQKKDRRDADEVTQIMVTECQALLRLFGIPYITAPMEAEAQCAELVTLGLVDGIVTDDSDIFLFGGTRVYKNMFNGNKFVECYLSQDLDKDLSLGRAQLINIAQLLGSDYCEGIPGIGPVTAIEIISEFSGPRGLEDFANWWTEVQAQRIPMSADSETPFRRKFRKSQAKKLFLPTEFPSPAVPAAYEKPDVDSDPAQFQWGVPDLDALRTFLMATIGWSQEKTDEVLVPVIRDMNRRVEEGTQSNITRFFTGAVGAGSKEAFAPRQKTQKGSKRMELAVEKLRKRKAAEAIGGGVDVDGVAVDGNAEVADGDDQAAPAASSSAAGKKRKARTSRAGRGRARNGDGDDDVEVDADDDQDDDDVPQPRAKRGRGKKARAS